MKIKSMAFPSIVLPSIALPSIALYLTYQYQKLNTLYYYHNGSKVGYIIYRRSGLIYKIEVNKKYRNNGFGRLLVKDALNNMWSDYAYGYSLSDAIPFWKKLGFSFNGGNYFYKKKSNFSYKNFLFFPYDLLMDL